MISADIIAWAGSIPPGLATFVLSALPVTESRLTIPVSITVWKLSPLTAYGLAMLGNMIPFFPIYFGFRALKRLAEVHAPWSVVWFERALHRVQKKIGNNYERYGLIAVMLFVAIPLPGTGVWSGSLLAVALELSWKRALIGVLGGMLLMGAIVLALTLFGHAIV